MLPEVVYTAAGKKRKQEVATAAASPSDEPRRPAHPALPLLSLARAVCAALAEFRIELAMRGNRNGPRLIGETGKQTSKSSLSTYAIDGLTRFPGPTGDSDLPLISTRRARPRVRQSTVSGNEPTTTHESTSSRHLTRVSSSKGLGDGNSLGTSESGNTTLQVEDTMAGALKPQQQRSKLLRMTIHVSPPSSYAYWV